MHSIDTFYTVPHYLGSIPANGRISTGRISFVGFHGGREGGGTYDVREANICIFGKDVFGGEVSYYGSIGYFEGFEAFTKNKVHPGRLSPSTNSGDRGQTIKAMRDWVAKSNGNK